MKPPNPLLIQDIDDLRPYYQAISDIRKIVDQEHSKVANVDSGFESWPDAAKFYCRTPKYLFLVKQTDCNKNVSTSVPIIENLQLYSPFGRVDMMGNLSYLEKNNVSKAVLDSTDWDIINVTDNMLSCYYFEQRNDFYYMGLEQSTNSKFEFYLITRVNSTQLVPKDIEINELNLIHLKVKITNDYSLTHLFNLV